MKKIILLFLSIITSVFAVEIIFHMLNYQMKIDDIDPYFDLFGDKSKLIKDHYLDIYDKFFIEDNGYYIKQRNSLIDVGEQKFNKNKDNGIKRIFIVGESVAAYYDTEILKNNLEYFIPKQKFEIINAGMGAYDSYRIEKILKEIMNYSPDYIIMMLGSNDGNLHNPIMINYLPYKYAIFRKSYVLNSISNVIMPRYRYDMKNIFPFFKHNIKKMLKDVNSKCPIIFVTLPKNEEAESNILDERRNFIRSLPNNFKFVYVADFDKELKSFIKKVKYDVFLDHYHYHKLFYDLISKLIICEVDKNISIKVRENINKEYIFNLLEKDVDFMFNEIMREIKGYNFDNFIEYVKQIDKDINNYDDEYRTNFFKVLTYIYRLYTRSNLVQSNKEKEEITYMLLEMLSDMITKYPDKEALYVLKAILYFKTGNKDLFDENINIALKINPNIVQKLK